MPTSTKTTAKPLLLRWSAHVPCSDVQDPLGLSLRGSARLASRLLHCITSITPRARYFSFLPWCFRDHQSREKGRPHALGVRDAVVLRENALALACVKHHQHHKGGSCKGGNVVGTIKAKHRLKGDSQVDLAKEDFAEVPALNAYFTSLVNLGCFVTSADLAEKDDEAEEIAFTWEDIQLSPLGLELATRYDAVVGSLPAVHALAQKKRHCDLTVLADLGQHGGLCELTAAEAADRPLLRDVFFGLVELKGAAHRVRRQSLLLILDLCRQFSAAGWVLNEGVFTSAVYFGELADKESRLEVEVPPALADVAARWRMFYFHHYASVGLEGMFSWLVTTLSAHGLAGLLQEELVGGLDAPSVRKALSDLLGRHLPKPFGEMTPGDLFGLFGVPNGEPGGPFDHAIRSLHPLSEETLEGRVRGRDFMQTPTGLALPLVLLAVTLSRYALWEKTNYGQWLANAAPDPYLDLVPPVLVAGLQRRFGCWRERTWRELAEFVLSRYVVRQHQAMSYEKSSSGDRCLLQTDGRKVFATGQYDKIGMGNPRLGSAIQILKDLALIEDKDDDLTHLTEEGQRLLAEELAKEGGQ